MNPKRVVSGRTGRPGWRFRFTDPATRERTHRTFWFAEKRDAEKAFKAHLEGQDAKRLGLPDYAGWEMPYKDLVSRFLAEGQIASDTRRAALQYSLEKNFLGLRVGSELGDIGKLTGRCRRLLATQKDVFIRKHIQQPTKQLSRWAASVGLLPFDPLSLWKLIPRTSRARMRRAFTPEEIRAIFSATDETDSYLGRKTSSRLVFETVLVTGNRPSAIYRAIVQDLKSDRLALPAGVGCKRNGAATLPPDFVAKLQADVNHRKAKLADPLLLSPKGRRVDLLNMNDDFRRCMTLGFVKLAWPKDQTTTEGIDPMDVEYFVSFGKHRGIDGVQPRDPEKIKKREDYQVRVKVLATSIEESVRERMKGTDLYCLRKTHISWARRLVNPDSVKAQVGHAARGIEEIHYLDLVNPAEASLAVWEVLIGKRDLTGKRALESAPAQSVDPNVDLLEKPKLTSAKSTSKKLAQVKDVEGVKGSGGYRDRTGDLQTASLTLSQLS